MTDKKRIEAELHETEQELAELQSRIQDRPEYGLGAGSSGADIWEQALARQERLVDQIEALRKSLTQVDQGSYGRCTQCGAAIDPERLEILPSTTLCSTCAQAQASEPHHGTHMALTRP